MRDGVGTGRGGAVGLQSLNPSPPRPAPPRGAGLKSCPIPALTPLRGGKNPRGTKRGGAG